MNCREQEKTERQTSSALRALPALAQFIQVSISIFNLILTSILQYSVRSFFKDQQKGIKVNFWSIVFLEGGAFVNIFLILSFLKGFEKYYKTLKKNFKMFVQAETADIKQLISKPATSNSEEFTLLQDSVRKIQIYQISIYTLLGCPFVCIQ